MEQNLADVPQDSVLGHVLFLIFKNDLSDGTKAICKLFADYKSLFQKVKDKSYSAVKLKNNLKKVKNIISNGKCYLILTLISKL